VVVTVGDRLDVGVGLGVFVAGGVGEEVGRAVEVDVCVIVDKVVIVDDGKGDGVDLLTEGAEDGFACAHAIISNARMNKIIGVRSNVFMPSLLNKDQL
jgi:hypothetical protein